MAKYISEAKFMMDDNEDSDRHIADGDNCVESRDRLLQEASNSKLIFRANCTTLVIIVTIIIIVIIIVIIKFIIVNIGVTTNITKEEDDRLGH